MKHHYSIICALDKNEGIGIQNRMPWKIQNEHKLFKSITMDHILVMGRNTFESLPGILPGRLHLVLSSRVESYEVHPKSSEVIFVNSLKHLHELLKKPTEILPALFPENEDRQKKLTPYFKQGEIFVAGGGILYQSFLPLCDKMHLSVIDGQFNCDTYFPAWYKKNWRLESTKQFSELDDKNPHAFVYQVWQRQP